MDARDAWHSSRARHRSRPTIKEPIMFLPKPIFSMIGWRKFRWKLFFSRYRVWTKVAQYNGVFRWRDFFLARPCPGRSVQIRVGPDRSNFCLGIDCARYISHWHTHAHRSRSFSVVASLCISSPLSLIFVTIHWLSLSLSLSGNVGNTLLLALD